MYNHTDERLGRSCSSTRCNNSTENKTFSEIGTNGCGCGVNAENTWGLEGYPLASVYSPIQNFVEIYDCEKALIRGTIFAQLDLPFVCGNINGGVYRG